MSIWRMIDTVLAAAASASDESQNLVLFLHIKFEISKKEIRGYVTLLMDIPSIDELRLLMTDFIRNFTQGDF
jgi:hypothetical protein